MVTSVSLRWPKGISFFNASPKDSLLRLEVILKMTFRSARGALTAFQNKWKVSCLVRMLAGIWLQEDLRKPEHELKKARMPFYKKLVEVTKGRARVRFERANIYMNDTYVLAH